MKRINFLVLASLMLVFTISFSLAISTISSPSVCCQQTTDGGQCINTQESKCDPAFSVAPTSCESTSFCQLGTCYNSQEGVCTENVPVSVCNENNGTWSEQSANELPQCQLGCCILGDQASFVTLTKCKSLSTFYGLSTDYRPEITSELSCIEEANSQDQGACVYFDGSVNTCEFTTRGECNGVNSVLSFNVDQDPFANSTQRKFYKDILCSAEELATECARQVETQCYEGEVYYFDSCGNPENVYHSDSDKSWNGGRAAEPDEICDPSDPNTECGNCDYLLGTTCEKYDGFLGIGKPSNSDYVCRATTCTDREGNQRKNGESWCVYDTEIGNGKDPAGSRHYREVCIDGDIQVEACGDFRNQICIHSGISTSEGEFSTAACRVNRWQDCAVQTKKDTCENTDQRDCLWVEAVEGINLTEIYSPESQNTGEEFSNPTTQTGSSSSTQDAFSAASSTADVFGSFAGTGNVVSPITGQVINYNIGSGTGRWEENELNNALRTTRTDNQTGLCVPMVSPGFDFWNSNGNAASLCSLASGVCNAKFERKVTRDTLTGEKEKSNYVCKENCDCFGFEEGDELTSEEMESLIDNVPSEGWGVRANAVCSALGDCGADFNINGVFTDDGYEWTYDNESIYFTRSDVGAIAGQSLGKGTGQVVALDYIINDQYKLNQDDYVYIKA